MTKRMLTLSRDSRNVAVYFILVFSAVAFDVRMAGQDLRANSIDLGKLADDYFLPLLANKQIKAASVSVVDSQKPIFTRCYGPIDLDHSVWRAASVSKALTAIAVMRLVEQGKVDLDTDINQYLKSFQIPNTFPHPITLRELLEHRSGLDERFIGDGFISGEQPPMGQLMKRFLPARVYPPGQIELYSNYGYGLVGAVIEDVTGARFEDYMQASVLQPLGMNHSSFQQPLPQDLAAITVPGKWWYQHAAPAGGLAVTAADTAKFLIATMQKDSPVISASSFQEMITPQTDRPGLVHRLGYFRGKRNGYDLIGATGDLGTFHNILVAVPEKRIGIVILVSGNRKPGAGGFYNRFLDAQLGPPDPQLLKKIAPLRENGGSYERNARFAGLYRTVRYPHHELSKTFIILDSTRITVEADGALRFRGARWIQTGPLQFEKEDGSEAVSFQEDNAGRVRFLGDADERIAWYQSGYANITFYCLFTIFWRVASWRTKGVLRWLCVLALLHSLGWVAVVLITGPENLVLGLPWALKGFLWIGTAVPLMAVSVIYIAWRERTILTVAAAMVLVCYVPFVFYWNLRA